MKANNKCLLEDLSYLKHGYVNPVTGLVFHSFNSTSKNNQRWVTKEKFELMRLARNERRKKLYKESAEYADRVKKYRADLLERNEEYSTNQRDYHNRKDVRESKKKYIRELRRGDALFNLSSRLRGRLNSALKSNLLIKKHNSDKYLGAPVKIIKLFLEKQFRDGMSWSNRNLWHIDHFFPLSMADKQSSIKPLSHFSNLCPLWANENRRKSKTIPSIAEIIKRNDEVELILKQIKKEHES